MAHPIQLAACFIQFISRKRDGKIQLSSGSPCTPPPPPTPARMVRRRHCCKKKTCRNNSSLVLLFQIIWSVFKVSITHEYDNIISLHNEHKHGAIRGNKKPGITCICGRLSSIFNYANHLLNCFKTHCSNLFHVHEG